MGTWGFYVSCSVAHFFCLSKSGGTGGGGGGDGNDSERVYPTQGDCNETASLDIAQLKRNLRHCENNLREGPYGPIDKILRTDDSTPYHRRRVDIDNYNSAYGALKDAERQKGGWW